MTQATETPDRRSEPSRSARDGVVVAGTYRVLERIGAGSMGEVFEAEHIRLGSRVAVKFLSEGALGDPRAVHRFQSEARAVAGVQSEHVVRVFDCGELPDGRPYLVMERLFGEDLRSLLARAGVLSLPRAIRLVTDACQGLAAVHGAGVIHRDLKPANLFVTRRAGASDICKILDFGVAKTVASEATQHGHLLGTLRYMAPEQLENSSSATARTDIYSLAAILYECLTGAPVHSGSTFQQTMFGILNDAPKPMSKFRTVPPELERIVLRALSKNPKDRPASAKDLLRALRPFANLGEAAEPDGAPTLADDSLDGGVRSPERQRRGGKLYAASLFAMTFALGLAGGAVVERVLMRASYEKARAIPKAAAPGNPAPAIAAVSPSRPAPASPAPASPATVSLATASPAPPSARNEATVIPQQPLVAARTTSKERKPANLAGGAQKPARDSALAERFDATNPYAD